MNKKVMVIDDMPDIVDMVSRMLESENYDVVTAYSGEECMEKIRDEKPDLILLDVMMKPMDGWQILNSLKLDKELSTIPVSMLTVVLLTPEIMEDKPIDNIENYILKPFSKDGLLDDVKNIFKEEEEISSIVYLLEEGDNRSLAEEYEALAKAVNRHRNLLRVLLESTQTEFVESESVSNVVKSQELMIELSVKRMEEIRGMIKRTVTNTA
ncbi:MAG: response regulator [Halobacteriota archaeon]|nr:response regulator [Halobacteriota archaeon]